MRRSRQVRRRPLRRLRRLQRLQRLPVWRRLLRNQHRVRLGLQLQLLLVVGFLPPLLVSTEVGRLRRFDLALNRRSAVMIAACTDLIAKPSRRLGIDKPWVGEADNPLSQSGEFLPYDGDRYRER